MIDLCIHTYFPGMMIGVGIAWILNQSTLIVSDLTNNMVKTIEQSDLYSYQFQIYWSD